MIKVHPHSWTTRASIPLLAASLVVSALVSVAPLGMAGATQVAPPGQLGAPTVVPSNGSHSKGSVAVTWTVDEPPSGPAAITRFQVRAVDHPARSCKASGSKSSCTVTGLVNGFSYAFEVRAKNDGGWGPFSSPSSAVTPIGAPAPPTAVAVTTDNRSAHVTWSAPISDGGSPVTSYRVTSDPASTTCTSATPGDCAFHGLRNGWSYTFRVVAKNSLGTSDATFSAPATPSTVPGAPQNVGGLGGDRSILVAWSPPARSGGSPVQSYKVFDGHTQAVVCVTSQTACLVSGLNNGWQYSYFVMARNSRGWGPPSPFSSPALAATTPSSPNNFHADAGDGYVNVGWTAPSSTGGAAIDAYVVYIIGNPTPVCQTVALGCAVMGLTNGTAYAFQVVAHNSRGFGPAATSGYATPHVQPVVVARFYGNGDQSPPAFTIPSWSTHWTESWSYNSCPFNYGNFITWIWKLDGDGYTSDSGLNELGGGGSGTNYYYDTGVFQVDVISECNWTDTITYYPPGA